VSEKWAQDVTAALTQATVTEEFGYLTADVEPGDWTGSLLTARDELGCAFFDFLTAVDEEAEGFSIVLHTYCPDRRERLLVRTRVPRENPSLPTATDVYSGAAWHERETHEMFGVDFPGHPHLVPLLLPDEFEGHPLRKDFVLAARAAKSWPGAKEPGESEHGAPSRRKMTPPGVPGPEWGADAAEAEPEAADDAPAGEG
jgi:NADH-quinone oxidoreductase subunit C